MTGLEIWLLAIGLAMDCLAVSIASGIILRRIQWRPMLIMAFFFGLFQAIMPLLGWLGASTFSHLIESVDQKLFVYPLPGRNHRICFFFYVPYRINLRHSLRMRHCQKTSC